jgi:hypothetical protein
MNIRTKKKIRVKNIKKSIKGGSLQGMNNLEYQSPIQESINQNLPSELNNENILPKVIEEQIHEGNEKDLESDAENDLGEYFFDESNGENLIISQPYGDEVRLILDKGESLYGLNMNVISFDSSIKETKSFSPKAKFLGEETFIKKYKANDRGRIIFDYDKNDPSNYVREQIVLVPLSKSNNNFVVRNPKNIIAYTGNISIHMDFHLTGMRSSKEDVIFTKLKLSKDAERGYLWIVMDTYETIDEENNSVKIKNDSFICATMPKNGFKLHKLYMSSVRLTKSTKEYVDIKPPCVVYRRTNNFSNKQLSFLDKYKTNFF